MFKRKIHAGVAAISALTLAFAALSGCSQQQEPAKSIDSASPSATSTIKTDYDVLVVGAGGAGMSAALTAQAEGVSVGLIDKVATVGGNTLFSSSGMNASETKFQKEQGIEDSNASFAAETIKGGHDKNDASLVEFMANNSAAAIEWLDSIGIKLDNLTQTGGMSVKRTHRPTDGSAVGGVLVKGLKENIDKQGIEVLGDITATELVKEGDKVVGLKAHDKKGNPVEFKAKAIILATGGFAANKEMVVKYKPEYEGMVTTNPDTSTGDGMIMAEKAGAELVQMENIQIHPTVEQSTSTLIAEGIRGGGAILVNQSGDRFINEMETRDVVSAAELKQEGGYAYEILDQGVREANKAVDKYIKEGLVVEAPSLAELAAKLNVDPAKLEASVATYNAAVATGGQGDPFNRSTGLKALETGPFYAIKVAPGVHHTMGGVRVDTLSRALTKDGKPIEGLYAAGEVTGGIHGANRIGGNAVCDIIVFGRNAGEQASKFAKGL